MAPTTSRWRRSPAAPAWVSERLYRHFPARQALLEAVYKDQVDGLDALAAKLLVAESPGDALGEWMRAFVAFGRTKRSLSSALVETIGKNSELLSACSKILARPDRGATEPRAGGGRGASGGAVRPTSSAWRTG